jgi:hypothetical protein
VQGTGAITGSRIRRSGHRFRGDVAQLEEHLLCKQGVVGSSPIISTTDTIFAAQME